MIADSQVSALDPRAHMHALRELLRLLTRHRELTWEMTKREITERYAGQAIGSLWAVGHPLAQMAVYIFVFAFVFKAKVSSVAGMPSDYGTYLLAGLIPWIAFQDSMSKGSMVMVANAAIVKQVVFPIEILPIKGVLVSMITQAITTVVLMGYVLFRSHTIPWTFALLPMLWTSQFLAMAGVSYVLSAVGAYLRDIKDIVQLSSLVGIYLMPVVYQAEQVPERLRWLLYLNPFCYMTWCFQDACFYGRFQHPLAWIAFPIGSVATFYAGYRVFYKLKIYFGNIL